MKSEKQRLYEIIGVIRESHLFKELTPIKLRHAIEQLGPTFIKMGQILSSRDDIIPEKYCTELKHLRSDVSPMPFAKVKEILDNQFNGNTDTIFKNIEEIPIGSASIAQVHKATLTNGEKVVIKIQREGIYEMMTTDVKLLKKAISILQIDRIFNSIFDFSSVIDEMFESAKEEMDFQIEAQHMKQFATLNNNIVYLKVPKVFKYTTRYVLVMEYIEGNTINNVKELKKLGYNMEEIAHKLAVNYVKQAIEDGYFHADPHPDNIKIDNGKIVYLDFGMMGNINKRDKRLLSDCILAIINNDTHKIEHILLTLGKAKENVDHMQLCNDIQTVLNKNKTQDVQNIDIKEFANDIFVMLSHNNISLPKDITMLIRGVVVIEGLLKEISSSINLIDVLKSYVKPNNFVTNEQISEFVHKGMQNSADLVYIPSEVLTFFKGINSGELRFNIELNDSKHQLRNIEKWVHLIIITILDVAYIIGTSLIVLNDKKDLPFIFYIYLILGGICTLWLFYKLFKSKFDK